MSLTDRDFSLSDRDMSLSDRDMSLSDRDMSLSDRDASLSDRDASLRKRYVSLRQRYLSQTDMSLSEAEISLSDRVMPSPDCPKSIIWAMNQVPVARLGPIFSQDRATASRKLSKYLQALFLGFVFDFVSPAIFVFCCCFPIWPLGPLAMCKT